MIYYLYFTYDLISWATYELPFTGNVETQNIVNDLPWVRPPPHLPTLSSAIQKSGPQFHGPRPNASFRTKGIHVWTL